MARDTSIVHKDGDWEDNLPFSDTGLRDNGVLVNFKAPRPFMDEIVFNRLRQEMREHSTQLDRILLQKSFKERRSYAGSLRPARIGVFTAPNRAHGRRNALFLRDPPYCSLVLVTETEHLPSTETMCSAVCIGVDIQVSPKPLTLREAFLPEDSYNENRQHPPPGRLSAHCEWNSDERDQLRVSVSYAAVIDKSHTGAALVQICLYRDSNVYDVFLINRPFWNTRNENTRRIQFVRFMRDIFFHRKVRGIMKIGFDAGRLLPLLRELMNMTPIVPSSLGPDEDEFITYLETEIAEGKNPQLKLRRTDIPISISKAVETEEYRAALKNVARHYIRTHAGERVLVSGNGTSKEPLGIPLHELELHLFDVRSAVTHRRGERLASLWLLTAYYLGERSDMYTRENMDPSMLDEWGNDMGITEYFTDYHIFHVVLGCLLPCRILMEQHRRQDVVAHYAEQSELESIAPRQGGVYIVRVEVNENRGDRSVAQILEEVKKTNTMQQDALRRDIQDKMFYGATGEHRDCRPDRDASNGDDSGCPFAHAPDSMAISPGCGTDIRDRHVNHRPVLFRKRPASEEKESDINRSISMSRPVFNNYDPGEETPSSDVEI